MTPNLIHLDALSGNASVSTEITEIDRLAGASWVGLPGWVLMRPYLTSLWLRTGYQALTLAFIFVTSVSGWAALFPS
jgi:hypothetical protein